ncbi:MAG: NAD-dependent epimerase/dehydratase family protein [Bryobacterales bacterium]|nr:NAD-dependent epimerase/dehydratase family protein [Bryobacterales bacterium]
MRAVVIGGTGHIGTYLTPWLADAGFEVLSVSRGIREPYQPNPAWKRVRRVELDRHAEEVAGTFAERIAGLSPAIVVDLTCYTEESALALVRALHGRIEHFLHCGTIWVHGHSVQVPTTEDAPRNPFGDYGIRKAAIERALRTEARERHFPATMLHPGHIVGPGWIPLNPAANFNLAVFETLAAGQVLTLPNMGMETVHHVHASDVALAFLAAINRSDVTLGESFHIVSPAALTLRGYAERLSAALGHVARLRFLPWEEWRTTVPEEDAAATWDHIAHSPNCSIEKAGRLLGYRPHYTSLQAVKESLDWLRNNGRVSFPQYN